MEKIRVFPALEFVCENCGKNSFASLIALDMPVESIKEELKKNLDFDEEIGVSADFYFQPEQVICQHCKSKYEVDLSDLKLL
jgi:protein-arginine kinase activator protein McsA